MGVMSLLGSDERALETLELARRRRPCALRPA